jgi:hypothetical protein
MTKNVKMTEAAKNLLLLDFCCCFKYLFHDFDGQSFLNKLLLLCQYYDKRNKIQLTFLVV